MKNKRGNVAVIAVIIAIVAITAGIVGWMFAKRSQVSVQKAVETQPTESAKLNQQSEQTGEIRKVLIPANTASWQSYIDKEYGYEIRYPQKWSAVVRGGKDMGGALRVVDICEIDNSNCTSIRVFDKENAPGFMGEYSKASITIDGIRGTWLGSDNSNDVILNVGVWEFQISTYFADGINEDKKAEQQKIFDNMLSTLKFTN